MNRGYITTGLLVFTYLFFFFSFSLFFPNTLHLRHWHLNDILSDGMTTLPMLFSLSLFHSIIALSVYVSVCVMTMMSFGHSWKHFWPMDIENIHAWLVPHVLVVTWWNVTGKLIIKLGQWSQVHYTVHFANGDDCVSSEVANARVTLFFFLFHSFSSILYLHRSTFVGWHRHIHMQICSGGPTFAFTSSLLLPLLS